MISIHAPLAGRDLGSALGRLDVVRISIHAPLAGRDCSLDSISSSRVAFQSTRPLRGATADVVAALVNGDQFQSTRPLRGATARRRQARSGERGDFNPRAPCGARPARRRETTATLSTFQSTRPLRGATRHGRAPRREEAFQSTRPLRGATFASTVSTGARPISIHAPLAGRDSKSAQKNAVLLRK